MNVEIGTEAALFLSGNAEMEFSLQCGSWIGRIRRSGIEDVEDLKAFEVPGTVHDFDEIP